MSMTSIEGRNRIVLDAMLKAVRKAVFEEAQGVGGIGPIRIGLGKNEADDWWNTNAHKAKRRVGNFAATTWVNRQPVVTVIASPSGKSVLLVVPEGTEIEWITNG